jgi:hypothetical protein
MRTFAVSIVLRRLVCLLLVLIAAAAVWVVPAAASAHRPARPAAAKTLRLRPAFHRLGSASYVITTGRFVFAASLFSTQALGMLIDEQTGTRMALSPPAGCAGPTGPSPTGPEIMGGPWLLVDCSDTASSELKLYRLTSGAWSTVAPDPSIEQFCSEPGMSTCYPLAVGARWVQFDEACYHCRDSDVFQNLQSGMLRSDPRNASTIVDLNSPALAKRVCRPLRVAPGGSLFFDGSFAIAGSAQGAFLERCGTRLHERVDPAGAPTANAQAIIWQSGNTRLIGSHQLSGLFLPSRRRFVVRIPAFIDYPNQILLSSRHLYVVDNNNQVWVATSPRPSRR